MMTLHFLPLFLAGIVLISSSLPWFVHSDGVNRGQFTPYTIFECGGHAAGVMDTPDASFRVQSPAQCAVECSRRRRQGPKTCVGVNFHQESNVCETFSNVTDMTNFAKNVTGCHYLQNGNIGNLHCEIIFDVDECLTNHGGCSSSATCSNTRGSYQCTCNAGFQGDGFNCSSCAEWANSGGCTTGSTWSGIGYSLVECQSLCYFDASCSEVDYDVLGNCFVHFYGHNDVSPVIFTICTKYSISRFC